MDLNCDLGEGFGRWQLTDDEALLGLVTSANVACGFHAGDPSIMRRVCESASRHGVAIGAQVSYPDLVGFGRRFMDMEPQALADAVVYQVGALDAVARTVGTRVTYVKCHGALYHATSRHEAQARAVVAAVSALDPELMLLGAPGSILLTSAREAGLATADEAFVDRGYRDDGGLVSRDHADALVTSVPDAVRRALQMVVEGGVHSVTGRWVPLTPASLCVHGDTPGAVPLITAVRHALQDAGVPLAPFAPA